MPEKVSAKIKRLEKELSEEIGRSIELYSSIREQRDLIDKFVTYFVQENIAGDSEHAIRIVREYTSSRDNPDQLSFDLQ